MTANLKMFNPTAADANRPTQQQPIDTVWFDVSVLMLLPTGFMSGIPRTVSKLFQLWEHQPWTNLKFCAIVPDLGILSAITMRTIQKLSLIYGFELNTDDEIAELWIAAASAAGVDISRELLESCLRTGYLVAARSLTVA